MELRSSRQWVMREIDKRIERNPSYSLRSFSRNVGLSPSYLSRVIADKRRLSFRSALIIAESLDLAQKDKLELLELVKQEQVQSGKSNQDTGFLGPEITEQQSYQLSIDSFSVISNWYHFGITQLMNLDDYKSDFNWMASMLGISAFEVSQAIERLKRLGLVAVDESGHYYRTKSSIKSSDDVLSQGLQQFHKEILSKAISSLEDVPVRKRDISSMTIAINEEQLPKAKEEIREFQNKMVKILQKGKKTQVFNLGVTLIPLSKSNGDGL